MMAVICYADETEALPTYYRRWRDRANAEADAAQESRRFGSVCRVERVNATRGTGQTPFDWPHSPGTLQRAPLGTWVIPD